MPYETREVSWMMKYNEVTYEVKGWGWPTKSMNRWWQWRGVQLKSLSNFLVQLRFLSSIPDHVDHNHPDLSFFLLCPFLALLPNPWKSKHVLLLHRWCTLHPRADRKNQLFEHTRPSRYITRSTPSSHILFTSTRKNSLRTLFKVFPIFGGWKRMERKRWRRADARTRRKKRGRWNVDEMKGGWLQVVGRIDHTSSLLFAALVMKISMNILRLQNASNYWNEIKQKTSDEKYWNDKSWLSAGIESEIAN